MKVLSVAFPRQVFHLTPFLLKVNRANVLPPLPVPRLLANSLGEGSKAEKGRVQAMSMDRVTSGESCCEMIQLYCFRDWVYKGFCRSMDGKSYLVMASRSRKG